MGTMKVKELLEEVKIGSENYKKIKTAEEIKETFDEDLETYKVSDLMTVGYQKLAESEVDERLTKNLKNSIAKIKSIEDRQEKSNYLSESYTRMKFDTLKQSYNDIIALMEQKKVSRDVNKELLANSLALLRYKIEEMAKLNGIEANLNEANNTFQPFIDKEYKIVKESTIS